MPALQSLLLFIPGMFDWVEIGTVQVKFLHTKLTHPCLNRPTLDYADRRDNKDSLFGMKSVLYCLLTDAYK